MGKRAPTSPGMGLGSTAKDDTHISWSLNPADWWAGGCHPGTGCVCVRNQGVCVKNAQAGPVGARPSPTWRRARDEPNWHGLPGSDPEDCPHPKPHPSMFRHTAVCPGCGFSVHFVFPGTFLPPSLLLCTEICQETCQESCPGPEAVTKDAP